MMNRSCLARRIKCIASEPFCYIVACQAVVSSSKLRLLLLWKATRGAGERGVGR